MSRKSSEKCKTSESSDIIYSDHSDTHNSSTSDYIVSDSDKSSISNAESELKKQLRIQLGILTAATLQKAMSALGIAVPEQM